MFIETDVHIRYYNVASTNKSMEVGSLRRDERLLTVVFMNYWLNLMEFARQIKLVLKCVKYRRDIFLSMFIIILFFVIILSAVFALCYVISWIN